MATEDHLRILVITSRPLTDEDAHPITLLDVEEERRRIRVALKNVRIAAQVHFLPQAVTGAIKTALRDDWDIIHFTGHGTEDGRLLLENRFGETHLLSKDETTQLFSDKKTPLVFLSACYSEQAALTLHAAGLPTLVAIDARRPISDRAAIIFAEHFYGALAKGWKITDAFNNARESLALDEEVGDGYPPLNDKGKPEDSWSQRFRLIGDDNRTLGVSTGEYHESGVAEHLNGNLHERNANFVGRAKEIVEVVKAFDGGKALRVAILGTGGLGKTELSKAVAWWYAERGQIEAVLWASASHAEGEYILRDLASLLNICARAFGLPITEQTNFDEQKKTVRDYFAKHSGLVILDNWETIEPQARKELWDFVLSVPDSTRVLVTSRDVLPAKDARNYELETLAFQDAAQLFLAIAHNAGYFDRNPQLSKEESATLSAIVERLSGYPLAIEVVAGQTQSRSLSEIWEDLLRVPRNALEGRDEITGEPRGVWTSLDLSYNILPEPEKAIFRQMCTFLAPALLEDIAAVTQTERLRLTMDTLVKRSLVRMQEGAYSLLPIVRDYAESKLAESGQDPRDIHVRAANHYMQKVTLEGALMASEHLLELATRYQFRDMAEFFIQYTQGFYNELVRRGYWSDAQHKAGQLIAIAHALGDKIAETRAIGALASRYQEIGEYKRANELYNQSLSMFKEIDDKRGIMLSLYSLGTLAQDQGKYNSAAELHAESIKIAKELGDEHGIAISKRELGTLALLQGNLQEAGRLYHESLTIAEGLKDKPVISSLKHQLGRVARDQKNFGESERLYKESLELDHELQDKAVIARTLGELANLALVQRRHDEALQLYKRVLSVFQELKAKHDIAMTYANLGKIARVQGLAKEALDYLIKAFVILEELKSPYQEGLPDEITFIRAVVGENQFIRWLDELVQNERIKNILIVDPERLEVLRKFTQYLKSMVQQAEMVVMICVEVPDMRQDLSKQLAQAEREVRERGSNEGANYFAVLYGLMTGEKVADKIALLDWPLKQIAEETQKKITESEGKKE